MIQDFFEAVAAHANVNVYTLFDPGVNCSNVRVLIYNTHQFNLPETLKEDRLN